MRKSLQLIFVLTLLFSLNHPPAYSQSCVPTNLNNTVVTLSCNSLCTNLNFKVPHLKSTGNYVVSNIPYAPFQWLVSAGGTEDPILYDDDEYSALYSLPFDFCFYDSTYTKAVIGSNGLITFDASNANTNNAYPITQPIPYAGGSPNQIAPAYYPKAAIMGAFSDLDPTDIESLPDRKIQWRVEGTAPCRRFIVTYFHVGTFGARNCTLGTFTPQPAPTTFQMVMHESTGLIDVFIENKTCFSSTGSGNAILGLQNWNRNLAVAAPGKNQTNWTAKNEGYRFTPSGNTSKFVSAELLTMAGTVLATADTATTVLGLLDISFPNICPVGVSTQYIVRTTFSACPTNVNMISLDTIKVNRNNTLPVNTTLAPTTCGNSVGSVTVNVPAGVGMPPYQYSINGGVLQSSNVFSSLPAGIYAIYATDALGCDTAYQVTIIASSNLASTVSSTVASCAGATNGSLTVTPTAGTAPFTFSNNGGPSQASGTFTNLPPGSYTVVFTDNIGCRGTATVVVGQGAGITATTTPSATSCAGASDGRITVTPSGGVAPYTYSLNAGPVQSSNIFTSVGAGSYSIVVRDSRGCIVTVGGTVTAGSSLLGSIYSTPLSCPGANDGTVTLIPNNGVAPFTFRIDGGASQSGGTFTGVTAGVHTVVFTDVNGCSGTRSILVGSGTASGTTAATTTSTSCPGASNGIITITPVAGAVYTLMPGNITNSTGIFTGLAAGSYSATYTIPPTICQGAVTPATLIVSSGPALTGTATSTGTSCPTVSNGTITVTSPSGAGNTYTLNPGAVTNATGIFTGLAPNTYTVSFITAAGCSGMVTINPVVTAGPYLASSFTQVNPVCAGISDGTISITPAAGSPAPYTVTLTGPGGPYTRSGVSPVVFRGLAPGSYSYSFTDNNDCTGTGGPITLTSNNAISPSVAVTMPLCNGSSNGIVTLTPTGGVPPYQYSLGGTTYQAGNSFNTIPAGVHLFRIKDNVGCTKDTSITLTEPVSLTTSSSNTMSAGCSNNDGIITAVSNGGTAPYTYTISQAGNTSGAATGIFSGLATGSYTSTVKDVNGCLASSIATVVLVDNMYLTLGPDTTICVESSITFQPQVNPEATIFTWTSTNALPSTIANAAIKNTVATPSDTAQYVLNARWGTCQRTDSIIVNVLHKPVPHAGTDTAICNLTYAILRGSATNTSGPVNYNWSPIPSLTTPGQATTTVYPAGSDTTYTYTLTVTDNYGCKFSVTDAVNVRVQPPVPAYAGHDTIAVKGVPHQLFASGGTSYIWSPSYPLNGPFNQNPLTVLQNDTKFTLQVTDIAGCIGWDTVFVKVYNGPTYYIPNAFTPNGDGLNDVFRAIPVGMVKTEWFRIFNRYGETVFQTNQWLKGWDGRYQGKKQPIGAYVWIIKGTDRDGKIVEMKGTVMLLQ